MKTNNKGDVIMSVSIFFVLDASNYFTCYYIQLSVPTLKSKVGTIVVISTRKEEVNFKWGQPASR